MKIAICLKQIPDPEIHPNLFKIDPQAKRVVFGEHRLVMNPFDENALEVALQLKEQIGQAHLVALTYGTKEAEDVLRKALCVLVDEAILILKKDDEEFYTTAQVLAAAVRRLGEVDLILCGRQAGDWDAALVGYFLAEELSIPCVSFAYKLEMTHDVLRIYCETEEGWEAVESSRPVLVTVTNSENNSLRIAKVKDIMKAHRKPIITWTPEELGIEPARPDRPRAFAEFSEMFIPTSENICEFIEGAEPEEKVSKMVEKIRSWKVI